MGTMMLFSPANSLAAQQQNKNKGLVTGRQKSPMAQRPTQRVLIVRAQQEPKNGSKEILTQKEIDAALLPTKEALNTLLEQLNADETVQEGLAKVYKVIPEETAKTAASAYANVGKNTFVEALKISKDAINEAANAKSPVGLIGTWWGTFRKIHSLALKTGLEHTGTSAKLLNDVFKSKKAEAPVETP